VVHIDEGFDFLGFRIQRHQKPGTNRRYVYTFPAKKSLANVKRKVKAITTQGTNNSLSALLDQINPVLRGWTSYFRYAVANATFQYLSHYTWWRIVGWLRRKHRKTNWKALRRHYYPTNRWWPQDGGVVLFEPGRVVIRRYHYRGDIPTPWPKLKETA